MTHFIENDHRHGMGSCASERGLSLIELLISIVIGLVVLLAMSTVFVNSSSARRELQLSADTIENGRYAIDALTRELGQTGYLGTLATPPAGSAPDPAAVCTQNLALWESTLSAPAVGYQNGGYPTCGASPLPAKAGTDALFVQRASTCFVGQANCAAEVATEAYLQVSECGTEYSTTPLVLGAGNAGNTVFNLQSRPCNSTGFSVKRKLLRRIYYVTANNTLVYQDIPLAGAFPAPVVVVEGIENLQIEYADDTNGNGSIDNGELVAVPGDWRRVIGIRVGLISSSIENSRSPSGNRTFELPGSTVTAPADGLKRRAYTTIIMFETPTARRQS